LKTKIEQFKCPLRECLALVAKEERTNYKIRNMHSFVYKKPLGGGGWGIIGGK
jgi:hypothetical protein